MNRKKLIQISSMIVLAIGVMIMIIVELLNNQKFILDDDLEFLSYLFTAIAFIYSLTTAIYDLWKSRESKTKELCNINLSFSKEYEKYIKAIVRELSDTSQKYRLTFTIDTDMVAKINCENQGANQPNIRIVLIPSSKIHTNLDNLRLEYKIIADNPASKNIIPIVLRESKDSSKRFDEMGLHFHRELNPKELDRKVLLLDEDVSKKEYWMQIEEISKDILYKIEQMQTI